ncbi:hypothetical protein BBJ29_008302 [Phytophthora kernoviae]|uniref:Uncharacterized protein n=1 Tax=Phytophthora kernoviae TaxID=325452 RepID=A0A3R7KLI1_9STRA|nr:hypothetical protein BBJ29_008302 [Phytophthora kernoviae]
MTAVYAVLIREDEAFDPETQTHRVTYGMAVFLFMLPASADMLVQCEGFLRDEFFVDRRKLDDKTSA